MSTVFKKHYTMFLPEGAEVFTRGGVEWARWKDRTGKRREGRITTGKDGSRRVLCEAATWTAKYRDGARIVREVSTGCKDRGAALAFLGELEKRAEKVRGGIVSGTEAAAMDWAAVPLPEHLADFRSHMEGRRLNPDYVALTVRYLELLFDACGFKRIADLSKQRAEDWLASQVCNEGMGARVHNAYAVAAGGFGRWLMQEGRAVANPLAGIRKRNEAVDRRRVRRSLSVDELQQLIAATRTRPLHEALHGNRGKGPAELKPETQARLMALGEGRALAYAVMALTGLRLGELRSVHVSQVHLDHEPAFIELRAADEKARRGAHIPLPGDLAAEVASHIDRVSRSRRVGHPGAFSNMVKFGAADDDPLLFDLPGKMTQVFDRDLIAAGLAAKDEKGRTVKKDARGRTLDIHCLRHTFATWLAQSNVPLQTAQRLMRHSDPKLTSNVYTHLGLLDMGAAVSNLPSLNTREREAAVVESGATSLAPTLAPTSRFLVQEGAKSCKIGIGKQDGARPHTYEQKIPSLLRNSSVFEGFGVRNEWSGREDLNLRSPDPQSGALNRARPRPDAADYGSRSGADCTNTEWTGNECPLAVD